MAKANNFDYIIYKNNQDFGHSFLIRKEDSKLKKEIDFAINQILKED